MDVYCYIVFSIKEYKFLLKVCLVLETLTTVDKSKTNFTKENFREKWKLNNVKIY